MSDEGIATESDIPKCESCGSERRFEFQVLPQLLNHLKVHLVVCHFMIHLLHLQTLKPPVIKGFCTRVHDNIIQY